MAGRRQGLDFREGLKSSPKLEQARRLLRDKVPYYQEDRFFAPDIGRRQPVARQPLTRGRWPGRSRTESRGMTHDTAGAG